MRVVRYTNALTQAFGLLFRKPRRDTLYVFDFGRPVRHAFHTWFCWPLDVYFLDDEKRVVATWHARPFSRFRPAQRYRYAVETAPGVVGEGTLKENI